MADEVDRDRPRLDLHRLGQRRAVEFAAAQLGADAAEQLAHREGLGDVVVGADLEPDHLVDLGVLGGEDDDRHGAARAHVAADVEAARPRHHDVEDQQVEGDAVAEQRRRPRRRRRRGSPRSPPGRARSRPSRGPRARRRRSGCGRCSCAPGSGSVARPGGGPRRCSPPPRPTRRRSGRPSRRPSAGRSPGRGRSPPACATRCGGRSARRRARSPPRECRCRCRSPPRSPLPRRHGGRER